MPESLALATAYIEFVSKGVDTVFRDMDQVKKRVSNVTASPGGGAGGEGAAAGAAAGGETGGGMAASVAQIGAMAGATLAAISAAVSGMKAMAQAGLSGTGQLAQLNFQFELLSRNVAAVFLPVIELAIDVIRRLSDWFKSLTGNQQNALQGLAVGLGVGAVAATALGAVLGPVGVALGAVIGAIAAIVTGTSAGSGALGKLGEMFSAVLDAAKPFLDLMGDVFDAAFSAMAPVIDAVVEAFGELSGVFGDLGDLFGSVMEAVQPFLQAIGETLVTSIRFAMGVVKDIAPMFAPVISAFKEVMAAVTMLAEDVLPDLEAAFSEILDAIKPVVEWIAEKLVDGIKLAIDALVGMIVAIKVMWDHLKKGNFSPGDLMKDMMKAMEEVKTKAAVPHKGHKPNAPHRDVSPGFGSFISSEQLFKNIQAGAADWGTETSKNTKRGADALDEINDKMGGKDKGEKHKPPKPEVQQ